MLSTQQLTNGNSLMLQQLGNGDDYGFYFGVHFIRLVRDFTTEAGTVEPLGFVGPDLAKVLEQKDSYNVTRGLDPDQKGPHKVRTPGGEQTVQCVSESGLYDAVVRSKSRAGRELRSHVTRKILPAIRKWGRFEMKPVDTAQPALPVVTQQVTDVASFYYLAAEQLKGIGVQPGIALATAFNGIEAATGYSLEGMKKQLPALPAEEEVRGLTPTNLGELMDPLLSAKQVNLLLCAAGLQYKTKKKEWQLTEQGKKYGAAFPYSNNGHTGYQIRWQEGVIDLLDT
jgi:hypothetical protein